MSWWIGVAGTVIAAGNSLIVAVDEAGFWQRTVPPTMGQGFQVTGLLGGSLAAGGSIQLLDNTGASITSVPTAVTTVAG